MTLSELHESQPKPLPDHLRALANYCQWCARNVESLGDTSRWFLELETELRRIAALSTGWQPIETAPKDRWILLYQGRVDISEHDRIHIAMHDRVGDPPGWFADGGVDVEVPTHWQPLPAPPETTP